MKTTKGPLPLVLALLALLAGCGGGGGAASISSTTTTTTTTATQTNAAETKPGKQGAGKSQEAKPQQQSNGPAPTDPNPLPNQGAKAVAPGVPTVKHGDNSIQTYGTETTSEARIQAASLLQAYLDARAAGRWAKACTYFSDEMITRLNALLAKAKGRGPKGCAGVLKAFFERVPESVRLRDAKVHVLSMRVRGNQGFIIYKDGAGTPANFPMKLNGGLWKLDAPAGIPLRV